MKTLSTAFISAFTLLASAKYALAQCTLNGEVIPCSEIPNWVWIAPLIFAMVGIIVFIFWLAMLIDVIKNQKEDRAMWVFIIVFLNLLGAIIYYFAEKRKRATNI